MEFRSVKRSHTRKRKIMLYIDESLLERLEGVKPMEITNQEAIRQIIQSFLDESEALAGL